MAENFIRVKQINQAELSGYIAYIAGTGLTATAFVTYTGENIVYNTGDQIISGNKTFVNNVNISGTGTLGGLNLDNINNLLLSGMTINITGNSIVNIFNTVRISGNPVLTGVTQDSRAVLTSTNQTIAGTKTFSTSIVTNLIDGVDTINLGAPPLFISGGNELYVNKKGGDVNIVGGYRSGVINLLSDTNISGNLKINNTGVVVSGNNFFGTIILSHSNQTPANGGQTYYFAQAYASAPVINTTDRRFSVPRNCTVKNFLLQIQTLGTYGVGAQPAITYDVYNYTAGAAVGTLFSCVACNPYTGVAFAGGGTGPYTGVQGVNVNIPLVTGNQYGIRWIYGGGYATPATSVTNQVNLYTE